MATSNSYVIDLIRDMGEMDGDNDKVFVSKFNRHTNTSLHHFCDILQKEVKDPLKPTSKNAVQVECEFKPRVNKYYVPKKKSKLKVFTVREIRRFYEKEILETLPLELERQEKYLLRKIRGGCFKDEDTKNMALNLLKSDKPLSRTSWQMLMNLNPKGHIHSSQYILWNGKRIQINGSKGGKSKFICNYDVNNDQEFSRKSPKITKSKNQTRRGLLRDSLNIRFKPGPLQKKKELDDSYQKYNVGEIKVVKLPEIGLHIQPSYGTALEPKITTFLQNTRALDGTISEKWAEFACSVLGKATEEGVIMQTEKSVVFNLNYKYDQKRILMRNDFNSTQCPDNVAACRPWNVPLTACNEDLLTHEVQYVINRMLDSVEISLNQNSMYSGEDEPREVSNHSSLNLSGIQVKEKEKKRKYCELDRLDVTVIRISENSRRNNSEPCQQSFCSLGCICDSLECAYRIKDHCGKIECMFGCTCDFSKFKIADSLEGNCSEFIPGLIYLDKKINDKLAKEEQKFHQTVIVTDDKSILLKSRRRNWKTSKKYAEFYSDMPLRTDIKNQKFPEIVISKLNCENIEPWCMVHNLYKCFCKGKFVRSCIYDSSDVDTSPAVVYKDKGVTPVLEKTLPVLEKTLPVVEKSLPVVEKTLPIVEKALPAVEKTQPVVEKTQPVVKNTLPVVEKMLPVVEKTVPVVEKMLPVVKNTLIVVDKTLPVVEKTLPVVQKMLFVFKKALPVVAKTLPVVEKTLPVVEKTLPVVEKTLPVVEETLPVVEKTLPVVEKTPPVVEKTLPVIEKTLPVVEKTLPVVEKTIPVLEKTLPVLKRSLPVLEKLLKGDTKSVGNSSNTEEDSLCARTLSYQRRKFSDNYYRRTNEKILRMEKNDKKLQAKLITLIKGMEGRGETDETQTQSKILEVADKVLENNENIKSPIKAINSDEDIQSSHSLCAKMVPFESRKHSDEYYRKRNVKITKLEKKDKTLQTKLINLSNKAREYNQKEIKKPEYEFLNVVDAPLSTKELLTDAFFEQERIANVRKTKNKIPQTKLIKWLETNLTKDFLETIENGNWTSSLSRPSLGKVALYPWKFILSRYLERKNLFLLTTQKPFRIFIAVNTRYKFFDNCINVSDIPKSRIGNYPSMVQSLISKASHENFCILSGLSHCWELVGSVNKVNKEDENKTNPDNIHESMFNDESSNDSKDLKESNISDDINFIENDENDTKEISKWFIMTIEDDINELRFFRKGFFVKYDSIIRSINIARNIGKTVRLSSNKCHPDGNGPRFGIYATADKNANTLFIGPYKEYEPLGIETAKNSDEICDEKQTEGIWITVNKMDNLKVTNDPLLYLPLSKKDCDNVVTLDSDTDSDSDNTKKKRSSSSTENADLSDEKSSLHSDTKAKESKTVKPITIRKTDSFYHIGSPSLFKKLALTKRSQQTNKVPDGNIIAPIGSFSLNKLPVPLETTQLGSIENKRKSPFYKPVTDIAPQIKISNIASLCTNSSTAELTPNKKKSEGMFVLKPEEINKRLANNYFRILEPIEIEDNSTDEILSAEENRQDVEEFLDSSVNCKTPSDIYVISDDEDDNSHMSMESAIQNVWIACANIPNIGWISGRRNNENKLSFEFPGFAVSDYYDEEEALEKINQLFSRKVCVPKNIHVKWQIIEKEEDLHGKQKLCKENLNSDFILTRRGLIHKDKLTITDKRNRKDNSPGESESDERASEGCVETKEISGSEKIINDDNLSNEDNVQGNITAIASTSIDADGNDRGIKIYRISNPDSNEAADEDPSEQNERIEIISSDDNTASN